MAHILAVDPGLASGWVEWRNGRILESGEMTPFQICQYLDCQTHVLDEVVIESFTIGAGTAKKSRQPWSLHIIGVATYACERDGVPLIVQKPSDAKTFASNERLKQMGLWCPTKGGHANDAARHICLRLAKLGLITPEPSVA